MSQRFQNVTRVLTVRFASCSQILKAYSSDVQPGHPLNHHLVTIRAKLPESYDSVFSSSAQARISPGSGYDQPSEKALIRLHKQLILALQAVHRTRTQWRVLVDSIDFEEEIARNEANHERSVEANSRCCLKLPSATLTLHSPKLCMKFKSFRKKIFVGTKVASEAFLSISQNLKVTRLQGCTQTKI
jgi:hypothetical protein